MAIKVARPATGKNGLHVKAHLNGHAPKKERVYLNGHTPKKDPLPEIKSGHRRTDDQAMTQPNASVIDQVARGLADHVNGSALRRTLRTYLEEFDKAMTEPVRTECTRLTSQALQMAQGVGAGRLTPKAARSEAA